MATVRYSDTASEDRINALRIIEDYFAKINSVLTEKHLAFFNDELEHQLDLIEDLPELYPAREDFYYGAYGIKVRSFVVHWFTVFYTYDREHDEVVIWFIRSSKSDYSGLFV